MGRAPGNLVIVIFPYLFVYDGLQVDDLQIKPLFEETVKSEAAGIKNVLLKIAKFFRFERDRQIFKWSYLITRIGSKEEWRELKQKLDKLATVLRYDELSDIRKSGQFSNFDYFMFEIPKAQNKVKDFEYYEGVLNGEKGFSFHLTKGEVANPYRYPHNINPLILEKVSARPLFQMFYVLSSQYLSKTEEARLLKAMEWFNRSFSGTGEVDASDAVVQMETALEALLRTTESGIKAQLRTGILSLLGYSKELEKWIDQFWDLRNKLVHGDKEAPSFDYIAPGGNRGHRHLLHMARIVFTRCFDAILKIRSKIFAKDIHEMLISNEMRIKKALEALRRSRKTISGAYQKGAFDYISSLRTDDLSATKSETVTLGKEFLPLVSDDLRRNGKDHIADEVGKILNWHGKNLGDLALLYSEALASYSPFYFSETKQTEKIEDLALRNAAYSFFNFATWRLLTIYD